MTDTTREDIIEKIKGTHENIALTIGTILSLTLVAYFLSYSALANSEHTELFWFEMISSIFIVAALFFIQKIAFALLKIRYAGNAEVKAVLSTLSLDDLKS